MDPLEYDHIERAYVRDALRDFLVRYRRDVNDSAEISFRPMSRQYGVVFRKDIPVYDLDGSSINLRRIALDTLVRVSPHTFVKCRLFYNAEVKQIVDGILNLCDEPIKFGEFLERYQAICDAFARVDGEANIIVDDDVLHVEFYIRLQVHSRDDTFTFVTVSNRDAETNDIILTDASLGIENEVAESDVSRPYKRRKYPRTGTGESVDDV